MALFRYKDGVISRFVYSLGRIQGVSLVMAGLGSSEMLRNYKKLFLLPIIGRSPGNSKFSSRT